MVWERLQDCCLVLSLFECGVAMVMQHPLQWLYSVANMETCEIQMLEHVIFWLFLLYGTTKILSL